MPKQLWYILFLTFFTPLAAQTDRSEWMLRLNDERPISRITLPGTHDACATRGIGWIRCQDLSLREQLDKGVRLIDIRCRHIENRFDIHHSYQYEQIRFDSIIRICAGFLRQHPSECIVMSVKEEYRPLRNDRSFYQTFRAYADTGNATWYLGDTIPPLKEVRGKIVLFRRFNSPVACGLHPEQWADDATFRTRLIEHSTVAVQDEYKLKGRSAIDRKWNRIESFLASGTDSEKELRLNFCSASSWNTMPWSCARKINRKLVSYLSACRLQHPVWFLTDYPDTEIIDALINQNF